MFTSYRLDSVGGPSADRARAPSMCLVRSKVVTISSVRMAINAPRGFARCEDASQIRLGRVKNNNISLNWWAYNLRRKPDIQEPEPSTHTPNMCPVPRPTR